MHEPLKREEIEPILRKKWGDRWNEHPSWAYSKPGETIPWGAVHLLPIDPLPLSKKDMERGLEVAKRFENGQYHFAF